MYTLIKSIIIFGVMIGLIVWSLNNAYIVAGNS